MSRRVEETSAEHLDEVAELARKRQPGPAGEETAAFLATYYAAAAPEDVAGTNPLDLYGVALAHRELGARRTPGHATVRVVAPRFDVHGWASKHAVVQIVTDDMPFIVDSVRMAISARGIGIHVLHHPVINDESFVHVEVDRSAAEDAEALEADLRSALADVRAAVDDWQPLLRDLGQTVATLATEAAGWVPPDELDEAIAFLQWLADDNFTFLGARSYELLRAGGQAGLRLVPGSGLGILRDADPADAAGGGGAPAVSKLSPTALRLAVEPTPLTLTKANAVSTVHRPTRLDYIGVKRFDADGRVVGERRYLGLFTSRMYTTPPAQIPLLRRKTALVLEHSGFPPGSHAAKDLVATLDTFPRDELVQISPADLYDIAMGILHLQERRRTRLFLRRDDFGRWWSALVFLPRDRYNTDTRTAVQELLRAALGGSEVTYDARVTESVLARLHFVVRGTEAAEAVDVEGLERRIAAAVRDWSDHLRDLLIDEHGEEIGIARAERYAGAFAPGYRSDHTVRTAAADIARLEVLGAQGRAEALDAHLYRRLEAPPDELRLRVFRIGPPVPVSDLVPVLEDLGASVVDQRPYTVARAGADPNHIYDIGLRVRVPVHVDDDGGRVVDTLHAVWDGRTQSDGFHRLVLGADLTWREIGVVRAYARYLRQAGVPFSQQYVEECVCAHPTIMRALMALFHARFDLDGDRLAADDLTRELAIMLDGVASLDEDRVLRCLLTLVQATLRTNVHQVVADGSPKDYLSFKFDPEAIAFLPLPRPHREIFVYSPRVEGVHLRGGGVGRGGLRWSDRREDYRTEVLGLMKAQMVKNAVIVPAGAKGGFIVKRTPATMDDLRAEVVACYRIFISGLLDLTDNLVAGAVEPPPDVVRHDGDDPYLVVAADKGTATFSDLANQVAAEYGFWLGDAFASGGSAGYDHKRMGITARGAWESVKRHFRELGIDVQTTPITAVGIGDMSGDVFGNGMLLSDQLELVGAFNHLHVVIDPHPDPAASFAERQRLFDLPRSTWDDYDRAVLSPGGGVFARSVKSIPLTDEMRSVLDVDAEAMTPNELVRALLRAPVELLWNGGIGTYVKASTESQSDAGDKANDGVRVDATELRCKVIGEGGNLGLTQRARIEFARLGGRVNTDAIDNSAGVDCSDHEVNIKIVLDRVVADGDLTVKQRNELLAEMTDEVGELVLADNVRQNQALVNAVVQAPSLIDVHQRYLRHLEARGEIDRSVEFLPTDEALAELKAADAGLSSPEFAVLLAYTKNLLAADLVASDLPDDPWCDGVLLGYFPGPLRTRYPDRIRDHRLRREIVATVLANDVVDHQGITSVFRLRDETGAEPAEAVGAVLAATEIFDLRDFRSRVAALDHRVPAAVQTRMLLESRKVAERGARWLLRAKLDGTLDETIGRYRPGVATMIVVLPSLLVGSEKVAYDRLVGDLTVAGVPEADATRTGEFEELFAGFDCVDLAEAAGVPVEQAAAVRYQLEDRLGLRWLQDHILALPRDNRWQALARLSLREDLHAQLRRLAAIMLDQAGDPGEPADRRVSRWATSHEPQVSRLAMVLSDIRATGTADLATLSVGLREVAQVG